MYIHIDMNIGIGITILVIVITTMAVGVTPVLATSDGLKVRVHSQFDDQVCVRTVDDSHRAGCISGKAGDINTFTFSQGAVEVGEEVYACFSGYDEDCEGAVNGPEKEPIDIYQ